MRLDFDIHGRQYGSDATEQPSECGAFARSSGQPCKMKALANGRCRIHGGKSTGPRTKGGQRRALANLRQNRGSTISPAQ